MVNALAAFHPHFETEFIVMEGDTKPTLQQQVWPDARFRYAFLEQQSIFHKTALLNKGLALSTGDYIIAYDVDLIPIENTLERSFELACANPGILVSGYRLMASGSATHPDVSYLETGPEDHPSALRKYLMGQGLFGVCPVFRKSRLVEIGGWDEKFKGWGAEDQDITERYCGSQVALARFTQLTYLHLPHEWTDGWNNDELVHQNREYYAEKRENR
jgi:hypothetical protein